MKRFLPFIIIMFVFISGVQAQDKDAHREKIKALKTAYITQELNMSNVLAQKFWPIYNAYEVKKMELHKREHPNLDNIESISQSQAEAMLKEYLEVEREEYVIKKQLFTDLKKIITAKDIIKLHKLEADFNKKLIKEYRARKDKK